MVALVVVVAAEMGLPDSTSSTSAPKKTVVFVPTGKVKFGDFRVSFHEVGTLAAEKSVPVYGDDDGKIISLVSEGTVVTTMLSIMVVINSDNRNGRNAPSPPPKASAGNPVTRLRCRR